MGKTEVTSVACNHCGAPLEIATSTRFVTCAYCKHQLEVHRSGSTVYTEVLAAIDQRTQQIAQDLTVIKHQNELEAVDREWQLQREQLVHRDKHGNVSKPSATGSIIGSIITAVFGIFWLSMAASMDAPAIFPLFGVIFIVGAIATGIMGASKASRYAEAERQYQRRRSRVNQKARHARNQG